MRKTWKVLIFAALLCMCLGFAACSGEPDSSAKTEPATEPTENVVYVLEAGLPEASAGKAGDICLVAETGAFYRKTESGWQETEYTSYNANGSTLTVTYSDGSTGSYAMATSEEGECQHEFGEPVPIYEPLCIVPGISVETCTLCHESFPVIVAATGEHRYGSDGYTCLDCGVTDYFKDAELNSSGQYVIEDMRDVPFGDDGELVIPGEIDGHEVVIGEMAFGSETKGANTTITSVVIEEGVTVIGQRAFQCCTSLESVTLPESLTILGADLKNGSSSSDYLKIFAGCTSLREVHLGSKITVIGNQAFYGCSSLTSIDLPQSLKEIHYGAFQGSGLTHVEIPESVDMIENLAFSDCSNLISFQFGKGTIKGKVGSKVINGISSCLFQNCVSLAEITLPEGIEEIGSSAFLGCSVLAEIKIPANVTVIGDKAFQNCHSIASLTFGEGSKLKSIGSSAFYCGGNNNPRNEKLQTVILPGGLETIGNDAFTYCISLEWIVIPSTLQSFGSSVFNHCDSLQLFYNGDSATWSNIKNADNLTKIVHYFSTEQQAGWWYWNDDGVPQIWG